MLNHQRNPLRIAVYCHTLSPDSDEITFQKMFIAKALNACTDLAPRIEVYADDGFCPETQVRPQFQRLLQDAAGGRLDCIAACGWERLATSASGLKSLYRFFQRHGVVMAECPVEGAVRIKISP